MQTLMKIWKTTAKESILSEIKAKTGDTVKEINEDEDLMSPPFIKDLTN